MRRGCGRAVRWLIWSASSASRRRDRRRRRQQRVKLLVDEEGSDLAAALWDGCDAAVSSGLAHPEVRAALAAAGRAHRLDRADQRRAETEWGECWAATRAVELTPRVSAHAGALAGMHALRGADAVHLAGVLAVGAADTVLAAWDGRLRAGARAAGVQVVPPGYTT